MRRVDGLRPRASGIVADCMRLPMTLLLLGAIASPAFAGEGEVDFGRARIGEEHPDVRLPTIDGGSWEAISDHRGKKVLLIEFASW